AYGLEKIVVDGNDADAVYRIAKTAIDRARAGGGPALVEALTYRHSGHSRADPGTYRPKEEVAAWMAKDPIPMYRARLAELGISEAAIQMIEDDVAAQVDDATEIAKASGLPSLDMIETQVWADGGSAWRN
ncbi:MAG: Pyruvate dehydrogenase (Acetyl-transferring), partial [Rhodospirillales bacterium]|nr:Pyruvate dehydrogenase (Acetyl-transferring) [Rhodospirillales bacterium]